jgi:hypothetical protein
VGTTAYEWLGRRPHFRLFDKTFKLPPSKFAEMTDVVGNWWRTSNGAIVLLAANLTGRAQTVEYCDHTTGATRSLSLAPYEMRRMESPTSPLP